MRAFVLFALLLAPLASRASDDLPVPEGFVLQALAETDGQIARPKDWFFASQGTPSGWMWTISKEDTRQGPYETGMRIQMFLGVAAKSGMTRPQFAEHFLAGKRDATTVLRDCPAQDAGDFMRRCLEVLESIDGPSGPRTYRILYSMMWGKQMDMVVLSIFGAPPEDWDSLEPVINTMAAFRIVGRNLGKASAEG